MEFDKNKILTVVTAGQAKVGMKGWFGNNMLELEDQCKYESPSKLTTLCHGFMKAFEKDNGLVYHLFYPTPEPTYRELFEEWVKDNNVKEGTMVKVVRHFSADPKCDGVIYGTDDKNKKHIIGLVGTIDRLWSDCAYVKFSDREMWACPYTALEVVKETYRPFTGDELNNLVGKVITSNLTGDNRIVVERVGSNLVKVGDGNYSAKELLMWYTLDGNLCGISEEV